MSAGVLTVADIVGTLSLDTKLLAGADGETREVLWAHSCEMVDPAEWLGPHELLMTVGLCVPKKAADQAAFIARLDDAGLAGMVIGDHDLAPRLSESMFDEANRRGFPILFAGQRTSYAVIARHVAAANTTGQTLQVLKLSKLYHLAAYAGSNTKDLLHSLGALLSIGIEVFDTHTGARLLDSGTVETSTDASRVTRTYELHGHHRAHLQLAEFKDEPLDSFLLVHLIKIIEVAVDRLLDTADRRAQLSAAHMTALINGVGTSDLPAFLDPHPTVDGFRILAFDGASGPLVARAAATALLPAVVGSGGRDYLALVPVAAMKDFREKVEPIAPTAGISSVFLDLADVRAAATEARNVLPDSADAPGWSEYAGSTMSVLTRSRREASQIVADVLGPLALEDERATTLRSTLFAYLRNDRNWQSTAEELSVHRQTLGYRLRRIEEETNLNVSRSADLAAVWIAYQAWQTLGGV
ncbi:PucR family transcriptional regulator [Microbacterium sp. 22303]|uniref:PucR family transcriptional regulator n=1 Tax=Microbacterium sp. 22303 TaxID=3453905 RepID=UPI003F84A861